MSKQTEVSGVPSSSAPAVVRQSRQSRPSRVSVVSCSPEAKEVSQSRQRRPSKISTTSSNSSLRERRGLEQLAVDPVRVVKQGNAKESAAEKKAPEARSMQPSNSKQGANGSTLRSARMLEDLRTVREDEDKHTPNCCVMM
eukprot:TRINITY_DN11154_c0_g2_i2.p1 TRINITY_DN11154_c0_g2~~TRINITY_DN11154_c0_g2_i2.p1  ORF type:complete len:141 (+),score=6.56 TRINITY_DN11154_c0_g2_i2:95-517(+)